MSEQYAPPASGTNTANTSATPEPVTPVVTAQPVPSTMPSATSPNSGTAQTAPVVQPKKKSNATIFIIILIVVILCCCGSIITIILTGGGELNYKLGNIKNLTDDYEPTDVVTPTTTSSPTPTPTVSTEMPETVTPSGKTTPPGYVWVSCASMGGSFLKPYGWYTSTEQSGDTSSCYISKERITATSSFKTGFSVNMTKNFTSKGYGVASAYAKKMADALKAKYPTGASDIKNVSTGIYMVGIIIPGSPDIKAMYIFAGDDSSNKYYMMIFEAPENEFSTAYDTYAKNIMFNFDLP